MKRAQSGFAYIAAVVFLVVIAGIAVALLRLTDTQQSTVNQALLGARAGLAARAGIEWVFHQPATRCDADMNKVANLADFRGQTGFTVTVQCSYRAYVEGEQVDVNGVPQPVNKHVYQVKAWACNGSAAACPDAGSVKKPDYVERARTATFCLRPDGKPCEEELLP